MACCVPDFELDGAGWEVAFLGEESGCSVLSVYAQCSLQMIVEVVRTADGWLLVLLEVVVDEAQDERRLLQLVSTIFGLDVI